MAETARIRLTARKVELDVGDSVEINTPIGSTVEILGTTKVGGGHHFDLVIVEDLTNYDAQLPETRSIGSQEGGYKG